MKVTYRQRPDATPEQVADALATVYGALTTAIRDLPPPVVNVMAGVPISVRGAGKSRKRK